MRTPHPDDDDSWFQDELAQVGPPMAPLGERSASRRDRHLAIVLIALIAVTLGAGLALGAFSAPKSAATEAPVLSAADQRALDLAATRGGTTLLDDGELLERLDRLIEAREDAKEEARRAALAAEIAAALDRAEDLEEAPEELVAAPVVPPEPGPREARVAPRDREPRRPQAPRGAAPPEPAPGPPPTPAAAAPAPEPEPPTARADADEGETGARGALAEASAHAAKKSWQAAIAAYGRALADEPRNVAALVGRGQAYFETRQMTTAVADLEAALRVNPNHPTALLMLGAIAQEQGRSGDARGYYERYLRRYPSGRRAPEVRALLDQL